MVPDFLTGRFMKGTPSEKELAKPLTNWMKLHRYLALHDGEPWLADALRRLMAMEINGLAREDILSRLYGRYNRIASAQELKEVLSNAKIAKRHTGNYGRRVPAEEGQEAGR